MFVISFKSIDKKQTIVKTYQIYEIDRLKQLNDRSINRFQSTKTINNKLSIFYIN